MSLKPNTARLLIFLSGNQWIRADKQVLSLLLPDLSDAGRRSLVAYSVRQSWVKSEVIKGQRHLYLTDHGKRELELHFPLFSAKAEGWGGDWYLVVFLSPPKLDPQFRYLRNFLLERYAIGISRGNYLLPSFLAFDLVEEIHRSYRNEVMMFSIKKWVFGDEKSFVIDNYSLLDMEQTLSGISNQIEEMLNKKIKYSTANDQQKNDIFSVFNRLVSVIEKDIGLLPYYFPDVARSKDVLSQFFQLFVK